MLSSILRVAAIGNPKQFLREFEDAVETVKLPEAEVKAAEEHYKDEKLKLSTFSKEEWYAYRQEVNGDPAKKQQEAKALNTATECYAIVKMKGYQLTTEPGHKLFLSLLQTYTLPPALRKKVEAASKRYMKNPKPRPPKGSLFAAYVSLYQEYIGMLEGHIGIAKEALVKGVLHSEEGGPSIAAPTRIKAGPFVLVNTGAFSEDIMKDVAEVMIKAASLLQSHGFSSVCYGDVQVTNTIHGSKVLAFYLNAQDDLFVRANFKTPTDTLRTVLHELGHRHDMKVLKNPSGVKHLYEAMKTRRTDEDLAFPKNGDKMTHKGVSYSVIGIESDRGRVSVKLSIDGTERKATLPLKSYWTIQNAKGSDTEVAPIGFVTEYAKKSPNENYAELFAFYCLGRLSDSQKKAFEDLAK